MATEPLQCKILVLRVPIHCEGCKKKVKRVLQSVDGVYRCDIDARSNKVTVAVTGSVSGDALVKRLRRSGKNAEEWPEQQQQQQQSADSIQTPGGTKKQAAETDKPGGSGAAEMPASGDAEAHSAEQSNPKASSEATGGVAATLAQDGTESASADGDGTVEHAAKEAAAEQFSDPERTRKQQQQQQPREEKPVDAMVALTAASAQSSHACHLPPPVQLQQPPPVHVLSYSVARPTASAASYYAAAPAARAPPPQELPYTYPPCCYYPQPSPYHGSWAPQTGAASPAYDSYSDLFSDDNANSCIVM